jgi:pyruvate dehydrogenase E2 component (dihydrolipoamide acetyltransferase)
MWKHAGAHPFGVAAKQERVMPIEVKLPELGENLEGGEVVDIRVAAGTAVREGQTLLDVEAEKSTVEVPSPQPGSIAKWLVKKGDTVKVGQALCLIEAEKGEPQPAAKTEPQRATASRVPEAPRERPEVASPAALSSVDAVPPVPGSPLRESAPAPRGDGKQLQPAAKSPDGETLVPAGPATRRLARELGVDLQHVHGTGPRGRVSQEDVKAFVRDLSTRATPNGAASAEAPPLPDFEKWGAIERRPLEPTRRRTAEQMSLSWRLIPHVTQHDLADITDLEAFRKQQEGAGPKLTVTAFALKAVALALKQFPHFNSSLDLASSQLVLKRYYHVGVAVDTERGLLVPVLRDVDRKGVRELAGELAALADRARQKKLSADEMRGGTFTITNLGGIGGTGFTPIINYPEVAILGMSRARLEPTVRAGQVVPRLMLPLSLSYDHRVIDGADAARFTRRLAEMLENPVLMVL